MASLKSGVKGRAAVPLLLLAAVGVLIRLAGGDSLVSTDLIYSAPRRTEPPRDGTPEEAARSFYLLIDRGEYGRAWEISLEPDWSSGEAAPYGATVLPSDSVDPGWTGEEPFVRRLNAEIGAGGVWLRLQDVEARRRERDGDVPVGPVFSRLNAQEVHRVLVTGRLLGACTIFRWRKEVEVVRVDGRYRLLLEGTKAANAFYYQTWFSDLEKIGNLRGLRPSGGSPPHIGVPGAAPPDTSGSDGGGS